MLTAAGLWALVEQRAATTPEAEMLVDAGGRRLTFGDFRDAATNMAAGLQAVGVHAGDVVAWELPTWPDTVILAAALSRLGAVQVPLIAIYRDREVTHCCSESRARFLFTPGSFRGYDFGSLGRRVSEAVPGLTHIVAEEGRFPSGEPSALGAAAPRPTPGTVGWIFYTSGTSSFPKGAKHSDRALVDVAGHMAERLGLGHGDRYSLVFPFPHVGGLILLLATLRSGCTQLLDATFEAPRTVDFLAREGVTHAGTGTAHHLVYLATQRAHPEARLFADLRCCPGGGAAKPAGLHADIKAELGGAGVISSWGLTEAPLLTFADLADVDDSLTRTEGRAMPGVEIRVQDGELQVRAPQMMLGYMDSSLDAEAVTDGWFRTGDLGTIDAKGYVTITGRLKDVIIRNGENVSAKEVEDLLYAHPAIADAAVVGVPDPRTGERVIAVVAFKPGSSVELKEVCGYLQGMGLRTQALPEQLHVVDSLPRNPAGKVLKQSLRDDLSAR